MPLPFTVEEYYLGQRYMTSRQTVEVMRTSKLKESAIPLAEGTFQQCPELVIQHGKVPNRRELCNNGTYIKKRLFLGGKMPGWIRRFLPEKGLYVQEEFWNAYPYTFCRYTSEWFTRVHFTIEGMHIPRDRGERTDVFLDQPQGVVKEVCTIDIAAHVVTKKDGGVFQGDPSTHCPPLRPGWQQRHDIDRMLGSYKLASLRIDAPMFGLAARVQRAVLDISVRDLAIHAHRNLYCWQDDWLWMSPKSVRAFEVHVLEKIAANNLDSVVIPSKPPASMSWWS